MDDNHNQDGLNGMPLEPWMSQQHLSSVHPGLSSQIYNQPMSAQSLHDFMSHRALQSFSAVDPMHGSPTVSSTLQQYSLSPSVRHHQPEHVSISHERSAWSHLFSLDPSMSSMGSHMSEPQESLRHYLPQDTPHFVQNKRQDQLLMLKGNTKLTSFDNKSLPRMQFSLASSSTASNPLDNYSHSSGVSSSDNKIPQSTQLMNVPKKIRNVTKLSAPTILTISTDVPSLESSGSYSPVSPPVTDIDEPIISNSGHNTGRVAELFVRDAHEMPATVFPLISSPDQADIFSYLSEKSDTYSPDLNMQGSFSEQEPPLNVSHLLPEPLDVPLDMTTAFSSKAGKGNDSKESSHIVALSSDISDKPSLVHTILTKDQAYGRDFLNEMGATMSLSERNQPHTILATSDEKMTKPIKSTPKKSNFYGRDASLFSFVPPSTFSSETQASTFSSETHASTFSSETHASTFSSETHASTFSSETHASTFSSETQASTFSSETHASTFSSEAQASTLTISESSAETDIKEDKTIANEAFSEAINIEEQDKTKNATERSTFLIDEAKFITDVDDSSGITESAVLDSSETDANISTSSANTPVLEIITSQSLNDEDTLIESLDTNETVLKQNDNSQETENYDSANSNFKCVLNSNGNIMISGANNSDKVCGDENVNHWKENFDTSDQIETDFTAASNIATSKVKSVKRRKRKASGFQAKQRKKPVRKQLKITQSGVFDESSMNVEGNDYSYNIDASSAEVSVLQDYETAASSLETAPIKRKTRQLAKNKVASVDLTPRRSSSRKSKDNAMRLIELQADSNYSGVAQPVGVEEKKSTRKRKKSRLSIASDSDDLGEFSDDSTEDEKSDERDGDYIVDEAELEAPENDEIIKTSKKVNKEKKLGGLKISIKLSGNSSAEIVSGISDSFTKKKKKATKKKNLKNKGKDKVKIYEQLNETSVEEIQGGTEETVHESASSIVSDKAEEAGNSSDLKDRHMSLMEKYFSTANSATVARQIHKKTPPGKETKAKKNNADGAKSKASKHLALKPGKKQSELGDGEKQKASVKFSLDSGVKKDKADKGVVQEDAETEVPKFICGYCPQRYHNKQELLAHMEAHMVEMERKADNEVAPAVDENIKDQPNTGKSKSNRTGASAASDNITEKEKSKSTGDADKDTDLKHAQAAAKQKFKCGECGQAFDSKPGLLDHVRIHTAEKPFECDICHKCFTERNFLSAHRKTHGQEKLLRCLVCSKAFVDKADLNVHMQSHPRRSNIKSTSMLSVKKPIKKGVSEKHDEEDNVSSKKPKSFASALTGELDMFGKTSDTSPVLILTRRDGPSTEVKNGSKIVLSEPVVSLKPVAPVVHKPIVSVKSNNNLKKSVESPLVSSNAKIDNNKIEVKNSTSVDSNLQIKTPEATLGPCTCKECPDCVTRFLQSFD